MRGHWLKAIEPPVPRLLCIIRFEKLVNSQVSETEETSSVERIRTPFLLAKQIAAKVIYMKI